MYASKEQEVEINFENIYNIMAEKNKIQNESEHESELHSRLLNDTDVGPWSCLFYCCGCCK